MHVSVSAAIVFQHHHQTWSNMAAWYPETQTTVPKWYHSMSQIEQLCVGCMNSMLQSFTISMNYWTHVRRSLSAKALIGRLHELLAGTWSRVRCHMVCIVRLMPYVLTGLRYMCSTLHSVTRRTRSGVQSDNQSGCYSLRSGSRSLESRLLTAPAVYILRWCNGTPTRL